MTFLVQRVLLVLPLCGQVLLCAIILWLSGCTTTPERPPRVVALPKPPLDLDAIPDAVPRYEPRTRAGNPPSYEVFGKRYVVLQDSRNFVERGIASWYGPGFHGEKTSNGETYDMYAMTAAHKILPIPCYLRVTNLENGRSVVVRVNDRGPFHDNRIVDLSYTAAYKLGILVKGTAFVEIRTVEPGEPPPPVWLAGAPPAPTSAAVNAPPRATPPPYYPAQGRLFLQLGAFSEWSNARQLSERVARLPRPPRVVSAPHQGRVLHKVQIGPLASVEEADQLVAQLQTLGITQVRVVMESGSTW